MELSIFDWDFNILGDVSMYESLTIERNYEELSMLTLVLDGSKTNVDRLQKGLILATNKNPELGYIIKHIEYTDEDGSTLEIKAPSVNSILGTRSIIAQHRFEGPAETILRDMVFRNAITPENYNRKIPRLYLGPITGVKGDVDETTVGDKLDDFLYLVCKTLGCTFDVTMNHASKKFEFSVWKGKDRSRNQDVNSHVVFSKEFENVIKQNYINSGLDTRTTAMIAGEEEWEVRTYATVNDEAKGLDRIELFIDASDIKSRFNDEWGRAMFLTPEEYLLALENKGKRDLEEHKDILTFESEIDMFGQFKYGIHYNVGDIVSVQNDDLSLVMYPKISSSKIVADRTGTSLSVEFGSKIPTLVDKIKKAVR